MQDENELLELANRIGATKADIPGLWNAPGYPELTTAQMVQAAGGAVPRATPHRTLLEQVEHDAELFAQLPEAEQEAIKRGLRLEHGHPGIHFAKVARDA